VNVKVIDSIMGSGKTSYAIQMMQEAPPEQKFIYVTPFLDEVTRIKDEVYNREFMEPKVSHGWGTKLQSLKYLIQSGKDIVTTHALFSMADEELIKLIRFEDYTLILDEVLNVVSKLGGIGKDDIRILLDSESIAIDAETHLVTWVADHNLDTRYNEVRDYALAGNLYAVNGNVFMWNFPARIFSMFDEVYVLTYLFPGQLQRYYYDLHGIDYDFYAVVRSVDNSRYELIRRQHLLDEGRAKLKPLIYIYDGKLNDIGDERNSRSRPLSSSWFRNRKGTESVRTLKNNLSNYYRNVMNTNADDFLWTTFIDAKNSIKGKGYSIDKDDMSSFKGTACFVPFNIRATNRYRHKTTLAYCLNRFMLVDETLFFRSHGIEVDQDLLALSDLVQWLFRSAIRDRQEIWLYIPSSRMRGLLTDWLDGKIG